MARAFSFFGRRRTAWLAVAAYLVAGPTAHADTLKLERSVVVIEEDAGEGVMNVQNTSEQPVLLYSEVVELPDDDGAATVVVTPPVGRIEPGETQMVRFLLSGDVSGDERMKRATFEGIPPSSTNKVRVTIRQSVPVLIRPADLRPNDQPWTALTARRGDDGVALTNTGRHVVRLGSGLAGMPADPQAPASAVAVLPKTYILPSETVEVHWRDAPTAPVDRVRLSPANLYGYIGATYDVPLQAAVALSPQPDAAPTEAHPQAQ